MTTSIRTGNRRLIKLAEFLEKLPRKSFDYSTWCASLGKNGQPACGTKACALGWAATIPAFRRAGLTLTPRIYTPGARVTYQDDPRTDHVDACEAVFATNYYDTTALFIPNDEEAHATPKRVAKKIREFVKARS